MQRKSIGVLKKEVKIPKNKVKSLKINTNKRKDLFSNTDWTTADVDTCLKALPPKQRLFCHTYIEDYNATRAAIKAGYKADNAGQLGYEVLRKPQIKRYIALIQQDIEREVGISKIGRLKKLRAIADASLVDLYDGDWLTRKELETIKRKHPELCLAIREVKTKTVYSLNEDKDPIHIEYIQVSLKDGLKAEEMLFKAMGWNEAEKINITVEQPLFPDVKY